MFNECPSSLNIQKLNKFKVRYGFTYLDFENTFEENEKKRSGLLLTIIIWSKLFQTIFRQYMILLLFSCLCGRPCTQCNGVPRARFRGNYVFEPFVQSGEDDTFHRGVRSELYKRSNRLNGLSFSTTTTKTTTNTPTPTHKSRLKFQR